MYKKKKKGASIYSSGVSNTLFLTTAMVAEPCWQKNQVLQWQTSNSEYGRFYVKMNKVDVKQAIVHKDCEKKCDELSSELQDCKAQINTMKLTDTHCSTTNDGLLLKLQAQFQKFPQIFKPAKLFCAPQFANCQSASYSLVSSSICFLFLSGAISILLFFYHIVL